MQGIFDELRSLLIASAQKCNADCISLSGGLDSTILAFCTQKKNMKSFSIIAKNFPSSDLLYAQLAAKTINLKLIVFQVEINDLLLAIGETIRILQVFNPIEIRNNVVIYLVLKNAKNQGCKKIITGDGADELFAGYNFFQRMTSDELEKDLKRIWQVMHFPSKAISNHLGISICTPFLDADMIKFAKKIPADLKVKEENGIKFGKWILRKAFENDLPKSIIWRKKTAMQDGSGTSGLTSFLDNMVEQTEFEEKAKKYEKEEKVKILSKESLYYYEIFRKYCNAPFALNDMSIRCPVCNFGMAKKSHFCHMCGSFPI